MLHTTLQGVCMHDLALHAAFTSVLLNIKLLINETKCCGSSWTTESSDILNSQEVFLSLTCVLVGIRYYHGEPSALYQFKVQCIFCRLHQASTQTPDLTMCAPHC